MATKNQQRKYELANIIKDDFPLFVGTTTGSNHVLHGHDFTELVIVERGNGIHFTDTQRHRISAGDILPIPKGMKHGYENTEMLKITNVIFDISLLNSFPEDLKHIPGFYSLFMINPLQRKRAVNKKGFLSLNSDEISAVKKHLTRITRELQEKRTGYRSVCVLALADLVVFLSRKASRHNMTAHSGILSETLCYMEKNHMKNVSLKQLSRMAGLSPRSFQRIFQNYMGTSPFNHLMSIRLQHAKRLLEETELNASEIAESVGFGDSAYFTRQFKKTFCFPPTLYRKRARCN